MGETTFMVKEAPRRNVLFFAILLITTSVIGYLTVLPKLIDEIQYSSTTRRLKDYYPYPVVKLEFELYQGQYRVPEELEWQDVICQIKGYYLVLLQRTIQANVYLTLLPLKWSYSPNKNPPISVMVIANAYLEDGSAVHHEDVFKALRGARVEEFLAGWIWKTVPTGQSIFFETTQITDQVLVQSHDLSLPQEMTIDGLTLKNSDGCADTGIYELTFYYAFFDGKGKKPTDQEVQDLTRLTQSWLIGLLQGTFTKRVTVEITLKNWEYEEHGNYQIKLKYQLVGNFVYYRNQMVIPPEYVKDRLLERANHVDEIKRYIREVVWDTPPHHQSTFYDIKRVRMRSRISRFAYEQQG